VLVFESEIALCSLSKTEFSTRVRSHTKTPDFDQVFLYARKPQVCQMVVYKPSRPFAGMEIFFHIPGAIGSLNERLFSIK